MPARLVMARDGLRVWHNTVQLQGATFARASQRKRLEETRWSGCPPARPGAYDARLTELEVLSAARFHDLLAPGQVLLRLAVAGFCVTLQPA